MTCGPSTRWPRRCGQQGSPIPPSDIDELHEVYKTDVDDLIAYLVGALRVELQGGGPAGALRSLRHHLPAAQRMPMEPIAERAWGRQHHSSHLSTVGGDGCLAPNVGSPCGGVRRVGWRGLGMAVGRRSDGQGTFWGDLIGPNPTDRGKAGTKRSLLVDGEGGPLSIVVAGANVHDAKLLEATLDAIVVERPQPTEEEPQHLCLDKGYDNPSGRGAAARHGYREHIRRIGEEKLDASGDKRYR